MTLTDYCKHCLHVKDMHRNLRVKAGRINSSHNDFELDPFAPAKTMHYQRNPMLYGMVVQEEDMLASHKEKSWSHAQMSSLIYSQAAHCSSQATSPIEAINPEGTGIRF